MLTKKQLIFMLSITITLSITTLWWLDPSLVAVWVDISNNGGAWYMAPIVIESGIDRQYMPNYYIPIYILCHPIFFSIAIVGDNNLPIPLVEREMEVDCLQTSLESLYVRNSFSDLCILHQSVLAAWNIILWA